MLPFWTFFLRKRQFTVLLVISLIGAGLYALVSIPKESAPEVRIPIGIVSAVFPGASAEDVEKLVTNKIEDRIANLENLNKLTSSSREGVMVITAEFDANADLDASIQDLKDAVDTVQTELPREVEDPIVSEINFADQPILLISITGEYPPAALTKLGDDLQSELQAVSGVSRVEVSGVRARQVQIVAEKDKLEQYGVSLSDIVAAVQASNASLPVGSLTVDGIQYALQFEGDLEHPEDLNDVAITVEGRRVVYLRDIARITAIWGQCRKNYGMYGAFVGILRNQFRLLKSRRLQSYKSSKNVMRTFCERCGSSITWDLKGSEHMYILAGLLDGKIRITKGTHIFTKDKGGYYTLCDKLPKYRTVPK